MPLRVMHPVRVVIDSTMLDPARAGVLAEAVEAGVTRAARAGRDRVLACSLADVLTRHAPPRDDVHLTTIFSPFGLGILDLAVSTRGPTASVRSSAGTGGWCAAMQRAPW